MERFWLHFGPPNRSKSESKRKLNFRSIFDPKPETWLSWNGKRERPKSVEHCRRKKRRKSIGKEERPEHEHREEQQGKRSESIGSRKPARLYNRGGALARALRARALGRLERGSSLNFLKLLSGRAPWIARKRFRPKLHTGFKKCPPDARTGTSGGSKIDLRRVQGDAKMAPKWLPGGPPEPRPAFEPFRDHFGTH